MKGVDFTSRPVWSEWTMDVPAEEGSRMAKERFIARGYKMVDPVQENEDGSFTLTATWESPVEAKARRSGKMLLVAAAAITLVVLVVMARGIGDERLAGVPLLAAVILGGMGMNRLREPARKERRLMQLTVSPMVNGGCRVLAKGALLPEHTADLPAGTASADTLTAQEEKDLEREEQAMQDEMRVGEQEPDSSEKDAP